MSKGAKQVAFKVPGAKPSPAADAWVASRTAESTSDREGGSVTHLRGLEAPPAPKEKMSRFTIDVPESLHRRIKVQCAVRGQKMADTLRDLLEREFPEA